MPVAHPVAPRTVAPRTVALAALPAAAVALGWVLTASLTGPSAHDVAPLPAPAPPVVAAAWTAPAGSQPTATVPTVPRPSAAWVASVAARTGIPARMAQAYGTAQLVVQAEDPGCHLGWTTLAGIGAIESDHGRHDGATVGADGIDRPTVLGPPLDGTNGNRSLPDTDGGRLDDDTTWDRAVGPMQFIPQTWARWGRSVAGGVPDPSNVDDAALTASVYLCAAGQDMSTAAGWTAAIATYNAPFAYAVDVSGVANTLAARSAA